MFSQVPRDQRQTPRRDQRLVPPGQTPPRTRGRHPPGRHPPYPRSACWDTVNKRAVRIPLECILVFEIISNSHNRHLIKRYRCTAMQITQKSGDVARICGFVDVEK